MARVFSGIQPSGDLHLGNLLGAIVNWVRDLDHDEATYCIVDLHAITSSDSPADLRERTRRLAQLYLACGLDPDRCTFFVQSHVPAHAELGWLMECTASYGELSRMTQFKDKRDQRDFVSAALFTYPALMAADILLYDTDKVPVGDDQRQHVELCRDLAERFNSRYGETFVVPEHSIPATGARIMDLQEPTAKMSKSLDSPQGIVNVLDPPEVITKKFKRAVTDSDGVVAFDVVNKPGVSNLLSILAAATGGDPEQLAGEFTQYGPLKAAAADAVVELLAPIQARYAALASDPGFVTDTLTAGAARAAARAEPTLLRAQTAVGLR
jgi:tryptophanyl-tRNA synthetase